MQYYKLGRRRLSILERVGWKGWPGCIRRWWEIAEKSARPRLGELVGTQMTRPGWESGKLVL